MITRKRKNDIILTVSLLLISAAVVLFLYLFRTDGSRILITVNGKEEAVYSLAEDRNILLGSGEHFNSVVIKDGWAYISDASCPDKLCVHEGKIKYDGQSIVCLPNKTVITVISSDEPDVDFIS